SSQNNNHILRGVRHPGLVACLIWGCGPLIPSGASSARLLISLLISDAAGRSAGGRERRQVGPPVVAHLRKQPPAAKKFAAWRWPVWVDDAARRGEMRAGHARLLAQLRAIDLQFDAADGTGTAYRLCNAVTEEAGWSPSRCGFPAKP